MYDYGARFYDPAIGRWHTVDPLADDVNQIDQTPYNYSWNSPVVLADPDGRCPWCAVVSAAWEYGSQVYDNYQEGDAGMDAWVNNVDFMDVVVEGVGGLIPGGKVVKGLVMVGTEVIKSSIDVKGDGSVNHVGDGTEDKQVGNVVKKAAIGTGASLVGEGAGKAIKKVASGEAVEKAVKNKSNAYKNLNKSNNVAKNGGGARTKAKGVNEALKGVNSADQKLTTTKALNSTVGTKTGTTISKSATGEVTKEKVNDLGQF